jgi:hypothetical protein
MKNYLASAFLALSLGGAALVAPASAAPVAPAAAAVQDAGRVSALDLVQYRGDRWDDRRYDRRHDRRDRADRRERRRIVRDIRRGRDCRVRTVVTRHRGERIVRRIRTCR